MATLTNEQIEQKKLQLQQLVEQIKQIQAELVEAGVMPLGEDELNGVAGGLRDVRSFGTPVSLNHVWR